MPLWGGRWATQRARSSATGWPCGYCGRTGAALRTPTRVHVIFSLAFLRRSGAALRTPERVHEIVLLLVCVFVVRSLSPAAVTRLSGQEVGYDILVYFVCDRSDAVLAAS